MFSLKYVKFQISLLNCVTCLSSWVTWVTWVRLWHGSISCQGWMYIVDLQNFEVCQLTFGVGSEFGVGPNFWCESKIKCGFEICRGSKNGLGSVYPYTNLNYCRLLLQVLTYSRKCFFPKRNSKTWLNLLKL